MDVSLNITFEFTVGQWRFNLLSITCGNGNPPRVEVVGVCHETVYPQPIGYFSIERYLLGYGYYGNLSDDLSTESGPFHCIDLLYFRIPIPACKPL